MKKIDILLIEDINSIEIDVQNRLAELNYQVNSIVTSAEQAFEAIEKNKPDIVLMDIHLDGQWDGIEAASTIQKHYDLPVLFLSSESDIETLKPIVDTQAYGFIEKPFRKAVLFSNVELALNNHQNNSMRGKNKITFAEEQKSKSKNQSIYIRADYKIKKIDYASILFVEAMRDYVTIYTDDKKYITHTTMKNMLVKLPSDHFLRIHRSYIINLNKIDSIKYPELFLVGHKKSVPIGAHYKKRLFDTLHIL